MIYALQIKKQEKSARLIVYTRRTVDRCRRQHRNGCPKASQVPAGSDCIETWSRRPARCNNIANIQEECSTTTWVLRCWSQWLKQNLSASMSFFSLYIFVLLINLHTRLPPQPWSWSTWQGLHRQEHKAYLVWTTHTRIPTSTGCSSLVHWDFLIPVEHLPEEHEELAEALNHLSGQPPLANAKDQHIPVQLWRKARRARPSHQSIWQDGRWRRHMDNANTIQTQR